MVVDDIVKNLVLKFASILIVSIMVIVPFSVTTEAGEIDTQLILSDMTSSDSLPPPMEVFDPTMSACYSNYDHVEANTADVHASTAIGVWNGYWLDQYDGRWFYYYKLGGMAYSEGNELIRAAVITIDEAEGSDHFSICSVDHSDYIWSYPGSSNTSNNSAEISNLVISVALGLLSNAASIAWTTATSVINILRNGCNDFNSLDNHKSFSWSWSPDIDRTVQHVSFYALLQSGTTAKLTTEYAVIGPEYELLTTGKFTFTMTAPNTNNANPANMTVQEREQNGIQTIPRNQLQTMASSLGISDAEVEMMMTTEQNEFYFTTSAPTCTITSDSDLNDLSSIDTNTLHQFISAQIDRSELLINTLSKESIRDMEGSTEILDKHTKRLVDLATIEQKLEKGTLSPNEIAVLIKSCEEILANQTSSELMKESDTTNQLGGLYSTSYVEIKAITTRDPNLIHRGEKHEVIGYV